MTILSRPDDVRRCALVLAALLLGAALAPRAAVAQELELSGQAGVLVPTKRLVGGGSGGETSSLDSGLGVAGTAGLRLPTGMGVEASVLHARDLEVEGPALATDEAEYTALTGHLTYAMSLPGLRRVAVPFVGAGAGVREIDFGTFPADAPSIGASTDVAVVGLAGLLFSPESTLGLRLEARSYVSTFEFFEQSGVQEDYALLGAATLRLP